MGDLPRDAADLADARLAPLLARLRALARPGAVEGMARYGITAEIIYGVSLPELRRLARELRREPGRHELALALWRTRVLDARVLATLVEDAAAVSEAQMEDWIGDCDSWAICDACTHNLFRHTPFAPDKARAWVRRHDEFPRRAGFGLMAGLAVTQRDAPDELFAGFLALVERHGGDARNLVKKGASWALREIGKRRPALHPEAVAVARRMAEATSPGARWVGHDALRELTSAAVAERVRAGGRTPRRRG